MKEKKNRYADVKINVIHIGNHDKEYSEELLRKAYKIILNSKAN